MYCSIDARYKEYEDGKLFMARARLLPYSDMNFSIGNDDDRVNYVYCFHETRDKFNPTIFNHGGLFKGVGVKKWSLL